MKYRTTAALFVLTAAIVFATPLVAQRATKPAPATKPAAPATTANLINLNTATATEIATLPGIGPKTAELIVEYREKNGNFKKIEDLMNVRGIGEKLFLKLKDRITVSAK